MFRSSLASTQRRRVIAGVLVLLVGSGVAVGSMAQSSAAGRWTLASEVRDTETALTIDSTWRPPVGTAGKFVLDLELKNAADQKVKQWYSAREVAPNTAMSSSVSVPLGSVEDGTYTVHQGVFTENWGSQVQWNVGTQQVTVRNHAVVSEAGGDSVAAPAEQVTTSTVPTPVDEPAITPESSDSEPVATALVANASGNPLAGLTFYGENAGAAAQAQAWEQSRPADAALLQRMADMPFATWIGGWSGDPKAAVSSTIAKANGSVPVFVLYNIPNRDCGSYSAGGAASAAQYGSWIDGVVAGVGTSKVAYVVEPDGITADCADAARYDMIRSAVAKLSTNPNAAVYIDAGNPGWRTPEDMADRLQKSGITAADGFALNVSNFATTADNVAYGQQISALTGGKHFVVDTSRNGNGSNGEWCNPTGRALGQAPTTNTGVANVDAFIWGKTAGESDGQCNGGPAAGTFWPDYALGLAQAAWK